MNTMTYVGVLEIMTCGNCGINFAMSKEKYDRCLETGENWYCPNGHSRVFTESKNQKLQKEIDRLARRNLNLDQVISSKNECIEQLKYSVRAQKAAKTKILNRVKNGVCPCCNRTFANLQNHFKTNHPELLETKK